jgi:hypothetical protein
MRLRHNPFFAYLEQRIVEDIDNMLSRDSGGEL